MSIVTFRNVQAYLSGSLGSGAPGIILLQEWWGINDQIKGLCDRFAKEGFIVAAPDLYHGKVAHDANEANHLMSGLDFKAAVEECKTWAEYLKIEKKCSKVGVTGFCMGGALSIACASSLSGSGHINSASVFYGIPDLKVFPVKNISCPLLLNFGGKDNLKGFSDPTAVKNLVDSLKAEGKQFELKTYPEASHAFMNEKRPEVYREDDSKEAFKSTIAFFKKHLGA